jgi:subtilisin family serine protease
MPRRVPLARLLGRFGLLSAVFVIALDLPAVPVQATSNGSDQTYLVVYKDGASSASAPTLVRGAGGTLVYNYDQIGVAIVKSNHSDFTSKVMADSRVEAVAPSKAGATKIRDGEPDSGGSDSQPAVKPAKGDTLSGFQWDMRQIHAFEAQSINAGRRSVIVGDIDTGADFTHPDLSPNIDFSRSVSCIGGVPNGDPAAWKDDNGHGTHTAGTIAAARNGTGIVGVAPNVRLAVIKSGDSQGFFFPETVVCAFMWAGSHHINVTNNSYFADPFYWNCPSDPVEKAILKAETRAIRFSQHHGVLNVAAEGNFSDDLANPTQDRQSPDTLPNPPARPVDKSCVIVPTEVRGVVAVTADGNLKLKSFYSNYGFGLTLVTAPGGDSILQSTADAPNGRVLSTWPSYIPCRRQIVENGATYCYAQGTSMASPHVAGVAALIASTGVRDPESIKELLTETADAMPCPTAAQLAQYAPFPSVNNDAPQQCTGGTEFNGWYGFGQINALAAVEANSEGQHSEGG